MVSPIYINDNLLCCLLYELVIGAYSANHTRPIQKITEQAKEVFQNLEN